jgi:hypothetical protein
MLPTAMPRPWKVASARRRQQCAGLRRRCGAATGSNANGRDRMHGRETDFNQFPFLEVIDPLLSRCQIGAEPARRVPQRFCHHGCAACIRSSGSAPGCID